MDTTATPEDRERLFAAMRPMATDPGAVARSYELYRRLGELTEATADDPRIPSLAAEFADHIPADLLALLGSDLPGASTDPLGETFLAELPRPRPRSYARRCGFSPDGCHETAGPRDRLRGAPR